MQKRIQLTEQLLHILQEIDKKLNRKDFCEIHNISESKLSRILNGKFKPDFEILDYLSMYIGKKIKLCLN